MQNTKTLEMVADAFGQDELRESVADLGGKYGLHIILSRESLINFQLQEVQEGKMLHSLEASSKRISLLSAKGVVRWISCSHVLPKIQIFMVVSPVFVICAFVLLTYSNSSRAV